MEKKITNLTNFSVTIISNQDSKSDFKEISIKLMVELSPCHSGFHYDNATQTCECYSDSDIVSCSGSKSSIKRGYWFGNVGDKATVAVCPSSYCNFNCCETINGFLNFQRLEHTNVIQKEQVLLVVVVRRTIYSFV